MCSSLDSRLIERPVLAIESTMLLVPLHCPRSFYLIAIANVAGEVSLTVCFLPVGENLDHMYMNTTQSSKMTVHVFSDN